MKNINGNQTKNRILTGKIKYLFKFNNKDTWKLRKSVLFSTSNRFLTTSYSELNTSAVIFKFENMTASWWERFCYTDGLLCRI